MSRCIATLARPESPFEDDPSEGDPETQDPFDFPPDDDPVNDEDEEYEYLVDPERERSWSRLVASRLCLRHWEWV